MRHVVISVHVKASSDLQSEVAFSQGLEVKVFARQLNALKNRIFAMESVDKEVAKRLMAIYDAKQKLIASMTSQELELLGIDLNKI